MRYTEENIIIGTRWSWEGARKRRKRWPVLAGVGIMREEIRLGNEALAQHDLETAARYFQQVLDTESTELQKRIAMNRLHDIQQQRLAAENAAAAPTPRPRTRRKTTTASQKAAEPEHHFVRPPDEPVVVIKRY